MPDVCHSLEHLETAAVVEDVHLNSLSSLAMLVQVLRLSLLTLVTSTARLSRYGVMLLVPEPATSSCSLIRRLQTICGHSTARMTHLQS